MSDQHSPQEREIERFDPQMVDSPHGPIPGGVPVVNGIWVRYEDHRAALQDREAELEKERDAWKGRTEPDTSPGDVIAAYPDGVIVLDDGITTWNPARAVAFLLADSEQRANRAEAALKQLQMGPDTLTQAGLRIVLAALYPALDTSIEDREPEKGRAPIPKRWAGQETGEHWTVLIEHDRMAEGEPCVVTVEVENWEAGQDGKEDRKVDTLACTTPDQAREMADALSLYADEAEREDGTGTKPPAPCSDRENEKTAPGEKSAKRPPERPEGDSTNVTGGEPEPDGGFAPENCDVTLCRKEKDHDSPCSPGAAEFGPSFSDQEGEGHARAVNLADVRCTVCDREAQTLEEIGTMCGFVRPGRITTCGGVLLVPLTQPAVPVPSEIPKLLERIDRVLSSNANAQVNWKGFLVEVADELRETTDQSKGEG